MPFNRIKVLKFLTHFGIGGTERQFLYALKGLDRSRFDVRVGCLARIGPFMKDVQALKVPIWEYPTRSMYSFQTLRGQLRFVRDIRREDIQIIHAYGFYPNLFAILPAAMGTKCVRIASVRDMGVFSDRHKMKMVTQAMACRFADCVIANSDAVRQWLIKQGLGRYDIRVIPNGIAIPQKSEYKNDFPIRAELNIDRNAHVIAVVSRLVRTKGLEVFLEAAAALAPRFPSTRFLIVGGACVEPDYRTELENRAAALNLTGRVIFAGQRDDVPQIMREVDISVLPSLSESFSNSLLESMAHGLPVIATHVGGNPEVISDGLNGILIPPRDSAALARAISGLLESPELARRLGESARDKVVREYSLERLLRRTEDLYTSLLERRGLTSRVELSEEGSM
jgi:glycosyltransferase involved in cell wall biosynthesis